MKNGYFEFEFSGYAIKLEAQYLAYRNLQIDLIRLIK